MKYVTLAGLVSCLALAAACSSDPEPAPQNNGTGNGTQDAGPSGNADASVKPTEGDAGTTETPDADVVPGTDGSTSGPREQACVGAFETLLKPIDKVSEAEVKILSDEGGVKTVFVDGSGGGSTMTAATTPRVYVNLTTGTRVDVTDKAAFASAGWDLSFKRTLIFTNSGDLGAGAGGAVFLPEAEFASVDAAAAAGKTIAKEAFFDKDCEAARDQMGGARTSFADWFNYDLNDPTHAFPPKKGVWIVNDAKGKTFKVELVTSSAKPTGEAGGQKGSFVLKIAAL